MKSMISHILNNISDILGLTDICIQVMGKEQHGHMCTMRLGVDPSKFNFTPTL